MGIFGRLFGNENENSESKIPWIPLDDIGQLETIALASKQRTQVIFKHSTSCGISRMVLNMFTSNYDLGPEQMDFYFLDLLANRSVSNAVASTFNIQHQSPQLLILKEGRVVYHNSHGAISEVDLKEYV